MSDYDQAEQAIKIAKELIGKTPGFEDLANFYVMLYTNEELEEMGRDPEEDWVGQYVRGSIDSERGSVVLVNISQHKEIRDLTDTLCHEMGHALYELLNEDAKEIWIEAMEKEGIIEPEEAFADDFMRLILGPKTFMNNEELFNEITKPI